MAISVACECGKRLAVRDEMAGKRVKCPACMSVVPVPAGEGAGAGESEERPAAKEKASNGNGGKKKRRP